MPIKLTSPWPPQVRLVWKQDRFSGSLSLVPHAWAPQGSPWRMTPTRRFYPCCRRSWIDCSRIPPMRMSHPQWILRRFCFSWMDYSPDSEILGVFCGEGASVDLPQKPLKHAKTSTFQARDQQNMKCLLLSLGGMIHLDRQVWPATKDQRWDDDLSLTDFNMSDLNWLLRFCMKMDET